MDQYNQSGGSVTSVEDLVKDLLGSVFGKFVPGGGSLINLLMPLVKGFTGNDTAWGTPVMTNMTSNGLYWHQMNTQMRSMEQIVSRDADRNATREIVKDIERTKMAYEDWQRRNPDLERSDYEAVIEANTEQAMRNKLYSGLVSIGNRTFDLDGTSGVGDSIGRVAANLARPGARRRDNNAMAFGRYLAEDLFREAELGYAIEDKERKHLLPVFETDEKGNSSYIRTHAKAFDRAEWGDFGQKAISDLAASLSKDLDLIAGVDTKQADQISIASERFKAMLHEYARALEPLKDVFGEDMAQITNTLEKMTGMSMASMGPAKASAMANQLASRINNGQYSDAFLYANVKDMGNMLMTIPGMSSSMYMQQAGAGVLAADFIKGAGVTPSYMPEKQWAAKGQQLALGVSMSPGTQALAEHYSIWARDRELKDPKLDRSWEEFHRLMEPDLEKGVDARTAASHLSGAESAADRRRGRAYSYFREVIDKGQASRLATYADLVAKRRSVAHLAAQDQTVLGVIQREAGRNDSKMVDTVMDAAFSLIETQSDVHSLSPDSIMTALNQLYGQGLTDVRLDPKDEKGVNIANAVGAVINLMKESEEGTYYKAYMTQAGLYGGTVQQEKIAAEEKERAERFVAAQDAMFKSEDGIMQIFKDGFSYDRIIKRLQAGNAILNQNEPGKAFDPRKLDPENTAALLYAAGEMAQERYGDDEEAVKTYAQRMFTYGKSVEAKSGKFQLELSKFRDAVETGDWEAADMSRNKMDAYMTYGEAAVDKFLTTPGAYEKMQEGFRLVAPDMTDIGRAVEAIENGTTVANLDIVKAAAASRKSPEYVAEMAMAAGDAARARYGADDKAAQEYAQRLFKYGTSAEGGSSRFQEQLADYVYATEQGDKKAAAKALKIMDAYMTYGEDVVGQMKSYDKMYDAYGKELKLEQKRRVLDAGYDYVATPNGPVAVRKAHMETVQGDRLDMLEYMDKETFAVFNAAQEVYSLDSDNRTHKVAKDLFKQFTKTTALKEGESASDAWVKYKSRVLNEAEADYEKNLAKAKKKWGDDIKYIDTDLEDKRKAMTVLDNIMGVAGQGVTPGAGQADNLELISVLKNLNDTLNRMTTDSNGVLRGEPTKNVTPQDK